MDPVIGLLVTPHVRAPNTRFWLATRRYPAGEEPVHNGGDESACEFLG